MGSIDKLKIIHVYFPKGDSGYALRSWMLAPIRDVRNGTPQSHYNKMQMSTESVIERVNGILKMRFRCLLKHRVLHYDPGTVSKIINTCCALHNMCIDNRIPDVQPEQNDELNEGLNVSEDETDVVHNHTSGQTRNILLAEGRRTQNAILRRYFVE